MLRTPSVVFLCAVLSGCLAPTPLATAPQMSGDLALPAEAYELPPGDLHIAPLPDGASLAFTSVMLMDLDETGWHRIQVTLTTSQWRKPLALDGKDLTVTIEGTVHSTSLGEGGYGAHAVPEDWRLPDQPLYDEDGQNIPAGGVAYITWDLPAPVPPSASLEIDLWSAHYASDVPAETTVGEVRRDPVIIGRHEHLERFTSFGTEFWDIQKVVAERDGGPVRTLEVEFVTTLEQDLEDAQVGIAAHVSGTHPDGFSGWSAYWNASADHRWAEDADGSLDKGWVDVEDVLTLRIDLDAQGIVLEPGADRFDVVVGPAAERPRTLFVPPAEEWDSPERTTLFEQAPPPEDTGACEEEGCGGGGSG